MILGRNERYLGHMPYRLPILYVCAECGGEIRICYGASGGYTISCRTDARHDGLKSRAQVEQERSLQAVADATEKAEQLEQLAGVMPEVDNYLKTQRRELSKTLFGED